MKFLRPLIPVYGDACTGFRIVDTEEVDVIAGPIFRLNDRSGRLGTNIPA